MLKHDEPPSAAEERLPYTLRLEQLAYVAGRLKHKYVRCLEKPLKRDEIRDVADVNVAVYVIYPQCTLYHQE